MFGRGEVGEVGEVPLHRRPERAEHAYCRVVLEGGEEEVVPVVPHPGPHLALRTPCRAGGAGRDHLDPLSRGDKSEEKERRKQEKERRKQERERKKQEKARMKQEKEN